MASASAAPSPTFPARSVVAVKAELDAIYARFLPPAEWQAALGAVAVLGLLALSADERDAGSSPSRCRSPRRRWSCSPR